MKKTYKRQDGTEETVEGTAEELAEYEKRLRESGSDSSSKTGKRVLSEDFDFEKFKDVLIEAVKSIKQPDIHVWPSVVDRHWVTPQRQWWQEWPYYQPVWGQPVWIADECSRTWCVDQNTQAYDQLRGVGFDVRDHANPLDSSGLHCETMVVGGTVGLIDSTIKLKS